MDLADLAFRTKQAIALRSSSALAADLAGSERLPAEELAALGVRRALAAARFAMTHTRFYADHYRAAGLEEADLADPSVLAALPLVGKDDVRARFAEFRTAEASRRTAKLSVTGGSTGEPLRLLRDLRFPARALEWRLMRWWGVSPADTTALVSRHVHTRTRSRLHAAAWWPTRRLQLDALAMDPEHVRAFLDQWHRHRPRLLIGYVGAVAELARVIADDDLPRPEPPAAVAVTAAQLSPTQRRLIESTFGAPVYDHYRSAEVPWIAGECRERSGLHVFADVRRVEIVDPGGRPCPPGIDGEIVVSDLTNRVFPLLRYRIGDRAHHVPGPCPCGVTLPRISPIQGRTVEVLRLPGGQSLSAGLSQLFSFAPTAVQQFQIHQRADHSIELRVVRGSAPDADRLIEQAADRFRTMVRGSVPVRVAKVDAIPHIGGKVRYVTTELGG